ncbi:MAG: acetyl-CoA C-acetyltransferase [Dehalococcoidia bacterium]|nr:acetyl-CoA C-acetyltransferase [Dehalococcoidia bacterium]MSQ34632.1 acetyl-CoA C-acetyltransferase [Dehalococcoidia bacterium]
MEHALSHLKREIVITGAARTPIGKFGGGLSTTPATRLGSIALKAAVERSGIEPGQVDYVIMGNMLTAGLGQTPARQAAIGAGIPNTTSSMTINKACASGLTAVVLAAQAIQSGDAETVAAGGMENMSLAPHLLMNSRTGQRLGDVKLIDSMLHDGLWCPFENRHMGGSAEAVAHTYGVGRAEQDEFALRSQHKASAALSEGWFVDETVAVEVQGAKGQMQKVAVDEGPRPDSTAESLGRLKPGFPPGDSVTPGNASQISDGAAALVVMSAERASETGARPIARITGYAHAANEPGMLFDAPRLAVKRLLERTGDSLDDFDTIEVNEAFAAQVLANGKALGWDWDRVNQRGGAIALGHPIGASGARILVTLIYGIRKSGGNKGMAVICHAGGGAVAMSVEAV